MLSEVFNIVTVLGFIFTIWGWLTGKNPIEKIGDLRKPRQDKVIHRDIKKIVQEYKRIQHFSQNQNDRSIALNLEFFRFFTISPLLFGSGFLVIKELIRVIFSAFKGVMPSYELNVFSLMFLSILGIPLFRFILRQHIAPIYYFHDFHQLTLLKLLKQIEKLNFSLPKDILEEVKKIRDENLKNISISIFALSFYLPYLDYPMHVKKKIKKSVIDYYNLEIRLDRLLQKNIN